VLGAWWAGLHRRWWIAGILSALACAVRLNGLFVVAGLVVMYLVQMREDRRWRPRSDLLWLGAGPALIAGWTVYLHGRTGSWHAWGDAEKKGWGRTPAPPWVGVRLALARINDAKTEPSLVSHWADLLAAVLAIAMLVLFVRLRRWPEATFLGLSAVSIVCSTLYVSAPRYALVWFPGFLLAARLGQRRPWVGRGLVALCAPLMLLTSWAWGSELWIG
jgi:hypothetical protein